MITSYGFIYFAPEANPAVHRVTMECGGMRTTIVAVPEPSAAAQVAVELVEGGVQLIELCGIFGPVGTARVIEATGGRVPVGSVSFGAESVGGLARIASPS